MGGLSSPDIAAPPPAEVQTSAPPPGATETGGFSPADKASNTALADNVIGVIGGSVEDALSPAVDQAFAAAARISPDAVPPSVVSEPTDTTASEPDADGGPKDEAAATTPETAEPTAPTAEEQAAAEANVEAQRVAEEAAAAEVAWAKMSYQEKVIHLSSNEVLAERGLALAEKDGNTDAQTAFTQALAAIRDERRMLMLGGDKRPPEEKIKEAKEYRKQAQISRDEARKGGNKGDIDTTQGRLDGTDRYIQVLEEANKKTLKQLLLQLLKALGVTGMFLGDQAKEEAEAGVSASGTSTGQGR